MRYFFIARCTLTGSTSAAKALFFITVSRHCSFWTSILWHNAKVHGNALLLLHYVFVDVEGPVLQCRYMSGGRKKHEQAGETTGHVEQSVLSKPAFCWGGQCKAWNHSVSVQIANKNFSIGAVPESWAIPNFIVETVYVFVRLGVELGEGLTGPFLFLLRPLWSFLKGFKGAWRL